ncbi:UPF0202 protein [Platanthera guangdongensis]|uniref:UPF0202 protein n=1 Tax=Platanthera guangdongensis TaxID=2320717 RepID=A0ABR2M250_9ASPA
MVSCVAGMVGIGIDRRHGKETCRDPKKLASDRHNLHDYKERDELRRLGGGCQMHMLVACAWCGVDGQRCRGEKKMAHRFVEVNLEIKGFYISNIWCRYYERQLTHFAEEDAEDIIEPEAKAIEATQKTTHLLQHLPSRFQQAVRYSLHAFCSIAFFVFALICIYIAYDGFTFICISICIAFDDSIAFDDICSATRLHLLVSLLEENIMPRANLPPLLVHLRERRPEKLHYIGVSFGLTRDLFRFWRKHNFIPFYLGHVPNVVTGEHTCMVLRSLNCDDIEAGNSSQLGFLEPFFQGQMLG